MRLELFRFRYRDAVTGKWMRARYVATREEIAQRFTDFEILEPPEIREVDEVARYFSPHRTVGNLGPVIEIDGWRQRRRVAVIGLAT